MIKRISIVILICISSLAYSATNYYISASGNDANNGTAVGTPKLTLASVFSTYNLGSGDIIYVAAGTYTETGITVGADDEGFTIQGAALSGGVPTSIFASSSTARWLLLNNTNNDNITINKLTIKDHKTTGTADPDGGGAIKVITGATGLNINNCVFDNCDTRTASNHRGGAIYATEGITVTYCTFMNCDGDRYGGAISIELSPTTNSSINHCKFYSNNIASTNYGGALFFGVDATSTLSVQNSLFYKNNITGGEAVIAAMNSYSTLNMMNCTVTANGSASYGCGGIIGLSSAKINLTNTIIYSNTGTNYNDVYGNTGTITMNKCCYGNASEINTILTNTSPLVANPLFTNAGADDYTLQNTSTCIDYGTTTGAPTDDIRHYSRINNPDVGAFENGGVALPVELILFKSKCRNNQVELIWQTASELNNDYFAIESSLNGEDYGTVGIVKGCGNSNSFRSYTYLDKSTSNGNSYYRLKQVDYDGKFTFYGPISATCADYSDIEIYYSNQDDIIIVHSSGEKEQVVTARIFNAEGRLLLNETRQLTRGDNSVKTTNLAAGIYLFVIEIGNDKLYKKFLKN